MNRQLLREYIAQYEAKFDEIGLKELYKWRAAKQFQEHWDPSAENFPKMLSLSLSKTANLMGSGNYWPRRVICEIAEQEPEAVRRLFLALFDEEDDVFERVDSFMQEVKALHASLAPGKKSYQDHRATMVYLSLRFPDQYYFYKYEMFTTFCKKMGCDFVPRAGKTSTVRAFLDIANSVRDEIRSNNNLLKRHKDRIGDSEYFDANSHILTQDFIYAVTEYLHVDELPLPAPKPKLTLRQVSVDAVEKQYQFKGRYVDYAARQKHNKRIGDSGEELVLQYEKDHCAPRYAKRIKHVSQSQGDGLGYDILSVDERGKEKYIEVKTTTGDLERPFFITGSELEWSKKAGQQYYLYRLYNFDAEKMTADFFILQGDLSQYCNNPVEFEVSLKPKHKEDDVE